MIDNEISQLSERELEVLEQIATGATNKQIATELMLSIHTVKVHVRNIHSKLGVKSRTEAAMLAIQQGLITMPGAEETPLVDETLPPEITETVINPVEESDKPDEPELPLSESEPLTSEVAPPFVADTLPTIQPESLPLKSYIGMPPPPLAMWQQLYFGSAILLAILVALLPYIPKSTIESSEPPIFQPGPFIKSGTPIPTVAPTSAPPAPKNWRFWAVLPIPRANLGVVAYDDEVFAVGGTRHDNETTRYLDSYNPVTNKWTDHASILTATSAIMPAVLSHTLYVPGGCDDTTAFDTVQLYDPTTDVWRVGVPLPAPRCAYGLVSYQNSLYLFGGWDGNDFRGTIFKFTPQTDEWVKLETILPQPMGYMGATVLDDTIYLAGGFDGVKELTEFYSFTPATETWAELTPMQTARSGFTLVAATNRIYALGGGVNDTVTMSEEYNPETAEWSPFITPFDGSVWRNMGATTINTQIFVVGGWDGETIMDTTVSYQSIHNIFLPVTGFGQQN